MAPSVPLPRTRARQVTPVSRGGTPLSEDPATQRIDPHSPRSPEMALRFTDRDRADLPEISLPPGEITLLEGRAGVEAVRHHLVITCATRGRSVMQIVGGNRLDSTRLARRAQSLGLDPGYVLRASLVARGFTAYQLSVLIEERLPEHLDEHAGTALAIVSDPLALYTDEDVRAQEGKRLAEKALASLEATASEHACPVLILQPRRPDRRPAPNRRDASPSAAAQGITQLLERVRASASTHVRIRELAGGRGRVIERPRQGERYRVATPRVEQARLDRFAQGGLVGG